MEKKAALIKLLFLDVDGVLTDGSIVLNARGEETKAFNIKDGLGIKMLLNAGIEVVLVTGRASTALAHRAEELGINEIYQGVTDKKTLCLQLMEKKALQTQDVCSMGDDLPDLAMFKVSGLRIAVADAVEEVCKTADFVTKNKGGEGAVREVCELILKSKGQWEQSLQDCSGK